MAKEKHSGRPIEEAVTVSDGSGSTSTTHPAFAQIGAFRTSGGQTTLYGSDFVHQHYVSIKIVPSTLKRSTSRDWHFGSLNSMIEVNLSEAQWATFVSSMNMGSGVPCTLSRKDGELIPGIPATTQDSKFRSEVRSKMDKSIRQLMALLERVEANTSGLSKARREELVGPIQVAIRELKENLPFVADQFDEHVEDKVEAAKVELHGYMNGILQSAGLKALTKEDAPILLITHKEDDDV